MYDLSESASQNLLNRRDRFRASIRKQKVNKMLKERRKVYMAPEDPDLDKWEESGQEPTVKLAPIAEGLNKCISEEWMQQLKAVAMFRQQPANKSLDPWLKLGVIDNLVRGVVSKESSEPIRSLAALVLANLVYSYRSEPNQLQVQFKRVLIGGSLVEFLANYLRQLLAESFHWNQHLQNILNLVGNIIYDSDLFRNEFVRFGIINITITLYLKAANIEEHLSVSWLVSNITQAPLFQESLEPPPSASLMNGFTPILMNYLHSQSTQLVQSALQSFMGLVRNSQANIGQLYYVAGFLQRMIELVTSDQLSESISALDILAVMGSHKNTFADKILEDGIVKSMETMVLRSSGSAVSAEALKGLFQMVQMLCEQTASGPEAIVMNPFWQAIIQICSDRVDNDRLNQSEGEVIMGVISKLVQKLTFPLAESMLRRVPLVDVVVRLMCKFQDCSLQILFGGLKTIEATLMILQKYQCRIRLDLSRDRGFQRLLETMIGHPNYEVASLARSITEIFDIRFDEGGVEYEE